MMNLFKKNKFFLHSKDLDIKEYIYILNYTNELLKKYDQGIIGPILKNVSIQVLKKENNYFVNYITDLLKTLEIFECRIFLEDIFLSNALELNHIKIQVTTNPKDISEGDICINPETFSTILSLSYILSFPYQNQYLSNKENQMMQNYFDNIEKFLDKSTFENIIKNILKYQQNLNFFKDIQQTEINPNIKFTLLSHKEIILTLTAIIIMIIRSNL